MIEMQALTYGQRRAEYFQEQIAHWQRCLNWWSSGKRYEKYGWVYIDTMCSDCGERINFYRDALRALGEEPDVQTVI